MGINEFIKIGDRIKLLRKNFNLTQEEMANKLSIPRSTYANYESNKREPNSDMLTKISEVLNVSPVDLLSFNIESNPCTDNKNNEIQVMLETLDIPLAIFFMFKNFKCFQELNIMGLLSREDYIFLSQVIANNIVSTTQTFEDRLKKDLIDKFNNFTLSNNENTLIDEQNENVELLEKNNQLRSNIKQLKSHIKELKKENLNSSNNIRNTGPNTLFKSIKNHLSKNVKNEDIELEKLLRENEDLENEIKNLEKDIKDIILNQPND